MITNAPKNTGHNAFICKNDSGSRKVYLSCHILLSKYKDILNFLSKFNNTFLHKSITEPGVWDSHLIHCPLSGRSFIFFGWNSPPPPLCVCFHKFCSSYLFICPLPSQLRRLSAEFGLLLHLFYNLDKRNRERDVCSSCLVSNFSREEKLTK